MKKLTTLFILFLSVHTITIAQPKWRVVTDVVKTGNTTTQIYSLRDSTYYDYGLNSDKGSSKMADSVLYHKSQVYINNLGSAALWHRYTRIYDINGKPINTIDKNGNDTVTERRVQYTTNYKVKNVYHYSWLGPPNAYKYGPWSAEKYTYNNNDSISIYSSEQYSPINGNATRRKTYYYYDANNLLVNDTIYIESTSFGTSLYGFSTYTYDAQNRLIRDTSAYFDAINGGIIIDTVKAYGYNAQNQLVTDTVYKGSLLETHYYTYDASGSLTADSVVRLSGSYVTTYEYTSFDKIAKIARHATGSSFDYYVRLFNYEIYWPVGVSNVNDNKIELSLYPVPAQDVLNVKAGFKNVAQLRVTITDLQGRVIKSWQEKNVNSYKRQLSIQGLSSGQYIISFDTGEQQFTKKFTVQ